MKRSMMGLIAVGLLAGPMAGNAAALVSVKGGFTSFYGCVAPANSGTEQWLNGVKFIGDGATCSAFGDEYAKYDYKYADFEFAKIGLGTSSLYVTFQNQTSDLPDFNANNLILFTPASPQVVDGAGDEFLLGVLTFRNGVWTEDAYFGFTLTTNSGDPALHGHTLTDTLVYNVTPNDKSNTPQVNADYLSFSGNLQLGQLRAYELADSPTGSNIVTAEVWGHISSLHLDRFANPTGGGFVVPGPTPAPEPGSLALVLAAGGAFLWSRRLRARNCAKRA